MLRAAIDLADCNAPIVVADDGGIVLGGSRIEPVAHRLLRTRLIESDGLAAILVAERFADEPAGLSAERLPDDRAVRAALATHDGHPLDWACLTIDRRRGRLLYHASFIHSVPVFARTQRGQVVIDWDHARLLGDGPAAIDWAQTAAHLAGMAPYSPRTMVRGLFRSTAGATLAIGRNGVRAHLPAAIHPPGPHGLADGTVPERLLFDSVKALIAARPLEPARTAVEISGGMDSALVALAAAETLGPGLLGTGAEFRGAMGEAQRARRRLLLDAGGYDDLALPADRFAPFGPRSPRRRRFETWPQEETYPELFDAFFSLLADAGVDTLLGGSGGDELYPLYQGEAGAGIAPVDLAAHRYLTERGRRLAAKAAAAPYPPSPLQETCWQAAAGRARRLLRHGLWPVYPYHSPALARFTFSLPLELRRDRALLRRTLGDLLGAPVFETDYVKESFLEVALAGIAGNRDALAGIVCASPLLRGGLVDRRRVLADLEGDIAALAEDDVNSLFALLTACCFFQPDQ